MLDELRGAGGDVGELLAGGESSGAWLEGQTKWVGGEWASCPFWEGGDGDKRLLPEVPTILACASVAKFGPA